MTKRTRFLKTALQCWEKKDGTALHDLAIDFDSEAYHPRPSQFNEEDNRILDELFTELNKNTGKRLASERTRLKPTAKTSRAELMSKYCRRLSPKAKSVFITLIPALDAAFSLEDDRTPEQEEADALDRHYAVQIVKKLDTIVSRALSLDRLSVTSIPNKSVQRYFQEAHDCYLYGFNTACVVLCRSILESALRDVIPHEERSGAGNVIEMVHVAKWRGLLAAEQVDWAEDTWKSGCLVIHDYQTFENRYQPAKLEELFWKTRAIVGSLYSAQTPQGNRTG